MKSCEVIRDEARFLSVLSCCGQNLPDADGLVCSFRDRSERFLVIGELATALQLFCISFPLKQYKHLVALSLCELLALGLQLPLRYFQFVLLFIAEILNRSIIRSFQNATSSITECQASSQSSSDFEIHDMQGKHFIFIQYRGSIKP
jgi:hypothetical protein